MADLFSRSGGRNDDQGLGARRSRRHDQGPSCSLPSSLDATALRPSTPRWKPAILEVLPEHPEVDAAAVGVSWQMHALQRPKRRLRHRRQADAAPLHRARREAPTDYSATPTAAVRRAVRPGLPIETSDQQVLPAHGPAGACRRAAHVGGPHAAQDPGRCRHQTVRADLRHSRFARWVGGQAPPLQAGRVQVIDFPRMPPQSTQAGATHGSRVSPGHWRLWAFAAVFAGVRCPMRQMRPRQRIRVQPLPPEVIRYGSAPQSGFSEALPEP